MNRIPFVNMFFQGAMGLSLRGDDLIITIVHKKLIHYSHETYTIKDFMLKDPQQLETLSLPLEKIEGEIIFSWPREYTIVRELNYPHANLKELREALEYQLDSFIPFSNENVYFDIHFDSYLVSQTRQDAKVLVIAVKKMELDTILSKLHILKINPSRVIISPFAFLPILEEEEKEGLTVLIGKNTESYSYNLYEKDRLILSAMIKSEAELANWLKTNPPEEILLTSANNGVFSLDKYKIPYRLLDDYSESYGCALYGLSDYSCNMSLIKTRKKRLNPQILLMCFIMGFLIFFAFLVPYIQKMNNMATLKTINAQAKSIKKDVLAVEKLQERITMLEESVTKINKIKGEYVSRIDVILELAKVLPNDAWVKAMNIEKSTFEIEGDAVSSTNLIPILENSPLFFGVGLISPVTKTQSGREKFRIKVNIKM